MEKKKFMLLEMYYFIKRKSEKYSSVIIGLPLLLWLLIPVIPNNWFGKNASTVSFLLLELFPKIGVLYLFLFLFSRKLRYLFFGFCFIFAFYITMLLGYLFLGP